MVLTMMCRFLSHQVITEMCLEIAQHVHKAAALANDVAEEIVISQVRLALHTCNGVRMQ